MADGGSKSVYILRKGENQMKKGIALLLTLALAAGSSVPAFAGETAQAADQPTTAVVSLGSIEDIMTTYSLSMRTDMNNLRIARNNLKDHEDDNDKDYYENQRDIAEVQYDENVGNAVLNAKKSYLTYCADNDRYAAAQSAADSAGKAYHAALVSLSAGFASQQNCDDLQQQYCQAQSTVTQLNQQLSREWASLRTLLNLPTNVSMSVKQVTADDLDVNAIPSVNYGADLIVMMGNDSKIKKAKLAYDYEQDYHEINADLDNALIELQQTKTTEEAAFKSLYDSMNSAYTVYEQDLTQVQQKQQELSFEQKALSLGFSSQKAVDDKAKELKTLQSTLANDRNTLFTSYLGYLSMKSGISTGS